MKIYDNLLIIFTNYYSLIINKDINNSNKIKNVLKLITKIKMDFLKKY